VQHGGWVDVRYAERTRDGRLRFPVFVRERGDISASFVNVPVTGPASLTEDLQERLDAAKQEAVLEVEGIPVAFTNLDRVFWPATESTGEVTKRDLVRYYIKIAPHILPHLRDRPLSLVRCPDGISGEHFFQKHWEKGSPEWVERVPVWSSHNGRTVSYVVCNNLATLLWMAQMAVLEIHPWYSRLAAGAEGLSLDTSNDEAMDVSALNFPDFLVADLDPNLPTDKETDPTTRWDGFRMSVDVALRFKGMLDELGLEGFVKTSGKTGLHVFIPMVRNLEFPVVRALAETLGRHLERMAPDKVTMEWSVKKRPERVLFDYNQNVRGKTLAGIFSPRPVRGAPVSFPISWARLRTVRPEQFTVATAPTALGSYGDPWQGLLASPSDLSRLGT
jgi:bifunctional non-homologous end joining protein LigD